MHSVKKIIILLIIILQKRQMVDLCYFIRKLFEKIKINSLLTLFIPFPNPIFDHFKR